MTLIRISSQFKRAVVTKREEGRGSQPLRHPVQNAMAPSF